MYLHSPETSGMSRRACLQWAAAIAAAPVLARAGCPCADERNAAPPPATPPKTITALRVCADPNNPPFSNRAHEGFEDKIGALIAQDLGLPLEYDWLPQRLG